ncbi:MAG: PAS domain-containing protein, partial [Proteobacteria bacterium]|nr:PAS domain-containing protein [Pseudomonadota bacterium]
TYNRTISHDNLNPINVPDEWETKALDSFIDGKEEISEVTTVRSSPYLRLLKPYVAMEGCIKCHDGYTVGDIRGGMSIAVAMTPYYKSESLAKNSIILTHFLLWLIGVFSIGLLTRNIQAQQQKILDSEEKFKILAEFSNDWEYWLSEDHQVVFMSPSCERITGYSQKEFIKNPQLIEEIVHPEDRETFQQGMKSESNADLQQTTEFRVLTRDQETKWLSQVWQPVIVQESYVGKRVSSRDITEKKKLEQQLAHAQKMEAIGSLAGGIAHDFNNILTSIIGYSQILSVKLGKESPLQDKADAILLAGRRASTLTNQLLAFSRKQVLEMRPMALNTLVLSLEDFLGRLIGEHIQLEIKTDPGAGNIVADAVQIEQILMNLTVNGRDAMPNGGKIIIETGETEIVHGQDKDTAGIKPGAYAVLKVSDTGGGIPRDIQEKIFEPFFTTKPAGKGTGLGLATVFGIVSQHKGLLQLDSSPGKGTSFTILLPKTDKEASGISVKTKESPTLKQGTEMLLVIDDDHTICNLIADTLKPHGYTVLTATSGREALELLRSHKGEVDLLLTDVIMPEMNGRALSSAAKLI